MASEQESTQLLAALFHLVCAAGNMQRNDRDLAAAEDILTHAVDGLAALRMWQEQAMPLLAALANAQPTTGSGCGYECMFCEMDGQPIVHEQIYKWRGTERKRQTKEWTHNAVCPVTQARALLAESEASDGQ